MQPAILLVEPQLAENIGAAARAMLNFGLTDLRLITPRIEWPSERARQTSSGADLVIDQVRLYRSVAEAVADLKLVIATSHRAREMVKEQITPTEAATRLRAASDSGIPTGILFGPERTGLVNADQVLCDAVCTVPTNPDFSSLNLAQCVLLMAWEYARIADTTPPAVLRTGESPPATKQHLMSFLTRLEVELDASGFLRVPHMRAAMVQNIRAMFTRTGLTDQEVRTLHGILTELVTKRVGRV
ncbi:MAG: RNA methyltransferase [Alphaproteobacteria bacterium]|nr:RNA methyltransferase [Alphaproteobacteria bacterium]